MWPPPRRLRWTESPNPAKGALILRGGAASRGPFMFFTPTSGPLVPPHPSGLRRMCSHFEEQGHGQADDRQDQAGEHRRYGLFLCHEKEPAHDDRKNDGAEIRPARAQACRVTGSQDQGTHTPIQHSSEESRVGKEGVTTVKTRVGP